MNPADLTRRNIESAKKRELALEKRLIKRIEKLEKRIKKLEKAA